MTRIIAPLILVAAAGVASAAEAVFNFGDPSTLNPAMPVPALKQAIPLDGCAFTDNGVEVSFEATSTGNTQVRLYGSYDAGPDLRVYDGDTMRLRCLDPDTYITSVEAVISLSGAEPDVWFIPSDGEWVWEEDAWHPLDDEAPVAELSLVSFRQSRLTVLAVTTETSAGISAIALDTLAAPEYFTLTGIPVANPGAGIYIRRQGGSVTRVIIR